VSWYGQGKTEKAFCELRGCLLQENNNNKKMKKIFK